MSRKIDWEAFHEGLGLVNQAIGPWRALARLEEVLQYGTQLREQVQLAEARLVDAVRALEDKQKELGETDAALAAVQADLTVARMHEEAEKERITQLWAEMSQKQQALHEKEVTRSKEALAKLKMEWEETKSQMKKEEAEKRAVIKDLDQSISSLRERIKGLG